MKESITSGIIRFFVPVLEGLFASTRHSKEVFEHGPSNQR